MPTYHFHIGGLVQGVGFRPHVHRLAEMMQLNGWVSNGNDGVHIEIQSAPEKARQFLENILHNPPSHSLITTSEMQEVAERHYDHFEIRPSLSDQPAELLMTPDWALCEECRKEINEKKGRRYRYPFTTCLNCGPRYSIIRSLPYDRQNTTMDYLRMCSDCKQEYHDIRDRRNYSQTNSCPSCAIPMRLYDSVGKILSEDPEYILIMVRESLKDGNIIAVKGIGGYLLLCDATDALSVDTLRQRKQRPHKPFAVLYPDMETVRQDVHVRTPEEKALLSAAAPIVLCRIKDTPASGICTDQLAPGLDKLGVMLPYTPLLQLIVTDFGRPLVATSGNVSGSPIIYSDEEALINLSEYADQLLTFKREIVTPQDDSVIQFTDEHAVPIMIRRSRGYAPNFYPCHHSCEDVILATGGELKSAFLLSAPPYVYISQFLGDQSVFESQSAFRHTLDHLLRLLKVSPTKVITDNHPGYHVTQFAREWAEEHDIPIVNVQHHVAHFSAVLGENNLIRLREPVMGVVWDGIGLGEDDQIWGGEFFVYEEGNIQRIASLESFPYLLGDKMSKEPRLSALALLRELPQEMNFLREYFSTTEWEYYQRLLKMPVETPTSSMGRLLDGIACLLGVQRYNSYEGESAMRLEALARSSNDLSDDSFETPLVNGRLIWSHMLLELLEDIRKDADPAALALKVFRSLAQAVKKVANYHGYTKIAFSGGVFQNALLVDQLMNSMNEGYDLYFHQQLSPNDECIGFGQWVYEERLIGY